MVTAHGVFWNGLHVPHIVAVVKSTINPRHCQVVMSTGTIHELPVDAEAARREILKLVDDQIEWWVERHARSTATEMHR